MAKQNCIKKKITAPLVYEYIQGKNPDQNRNGSYSSFDHQQPEEVDAFVEKERERIRKDLEAPDF